ncbi:MAG TPA: hypothetical protein VM537_35450 [Anaerolineae bacterium]|nr:hypothetical protein [Anaerolineae bacterium]
MEPRTYTSEYRDLVALCQAQSEELKKCQEERDKAEQLRFERGQELVKCRQERDDARGALSWLMHLAHGIGKDGGPPDDNEWNEAQDSAMAILDKAGVE